MTRSRLDLLLETVVILITAVLIFLVAPLWIPIAVLAPQALLPIVLWYSDWAASLAEDIEVHDAERRDEVDD